MKYYISNQINNFQQVKSATMEDMLAWIHSLEDKRIGVDIETTGLNFYTDKTLLVAIGNSKDQFIVNTLEIPLSPLKAIFEGNEYIKLLHNASFDYKFIRMLGIQMFNVFDTMLAEQVLTNGRGLKSSLEAVTNYYLKKEREKSIRLNFVNKSDSVFSEGEVLYAGEDVEDLIPIADLQMDRAKSYELEKTIMLENSSVLAFADIEFNGIKLDTEKWMNLYNESIEKTAEQIKSLDDVVLYTPELEKFRGAYQLDLFTDENDVRKVDINWSSPKQVLSILKTLFPAITSTEEDQVSRYIHPLTEALLSYKRLSKRTGTYGKDFLNHLYPDGRIRTNFKQILATGRVSSSGPNMQQIPADNRYRNCFIPSHEDYVIVSADYSSQELALIAFESQDPVWLRALSRGEDLHSTCAELVYGKEWEDAADEDCAYYAPKDDIVEGVAVKVASHAKCDCKGHKRMRTNVKTINFGLAYGMTAPTLAQRLRISEEEATGLIESYFKAFPSIHGYLEFNGNFAKDNGYVRTMAPFNRIRFFNGWTGSNTEFSTLSAIERRGKNTRIQGSGADMVKYAMIQVRNYIAKHSLPVNVIMQVHDQIDTEVHKNYAETWTKELSWLMDEAAKVIVTNGLLKVEAEISPVWKK